MPDQIRIKDLLLRAIVGINPDEREKRQDVLINITLDADMAAAGLSDAINDAVNYKTITKRVIKMVEASSFYLVERMAGEIAALCLLDPRVSAAHVLVEKPGALRFARSVGVEITRTREDFKRLPNRAFVALGSNIEPETNLRSAVELLAEQVSLAGVSPVYETAPVGKTDQANFLNAAVIVLTPLSMEALKTTVLQPIERQLGRVRTADRNAPRTIDLDIALFNYEVFDLGQRHIPDPDILDRPHVAIPLADLAPYYIHPETGDTLAEIAAGLSTAGISRRTDIALWSQEA